MIVSNARIYPHDRSGVVADRMLKMFLDSGAYADQIWTQSLVHRTAAEPFKVTVSVLGVSASFEILFSGYEEQLEFLGKLKIDAAAGGLKEQHFQALASRLAEAAKSE